MGELLLDRVPSGGLPGDQHLCARPSRAAPETQPAALPTAGMDDLLWTASAYGVDLLVSQIPRSCLCMPEARVFRRAGCREIRMSGSTRGEGAASRFSPALLHHRLRVRFGSRPRQSLTEKLGITKGAP